MQRGTSQALIQALMQNIITILNIMSLLVEAWDYVTTATFLICFCKAGIFTESAPQSLDDTDNPLQALALEIEELRAQYRKA